MCSALKKNIEGFDWEMSMLMSVIAYVRISHKNFYARRKQDGPKVYFLL